MEKRNSQCEHGQSMKQTIGLFCICDACVARCQSHLPNELDLRGVLHVQVILAAVNHICVIHEAMNGCKF